MGFMLIEKLLIKSRYHRRMTNDKKTTLVNLAGKDKCSMHGCA